MVTKCIGSYRDANVDSYSDKTRNVMASQRVKHSTFEGIGVFIFIEGIDCKDKFIVRQVAATQRRRRSAADRRYRAIALAAPPGHACILLHLITTNSHIRQIIETPAVPPVGLGDWNVGVTSLIQVISFM